VLDINAKEEVKLAHVFHSKLGAQAVDDMLQ
jgi:hypothetical protein